MCEITNQNSESVRNLDCISGIVIALALLAALGIYFLFYAPAIDQGVQSGALPAKEILWLEIHISVYGMSYLLYFTGLALAVTCFLGKATTRFPWVESVTVMATVLTVIGLVTGILFSKPAWNAWWVWDPKHTIALLNALILLGISSLVVLTRSYSTTLDRNVTLILLLFIAVALCTGSFLTGFMRNVHPQWFLNILFQ